MYPEHYPYIILSMAASFDPATHVPFCNRLVDWLRHLSIDDILKKREVSDRCQSVMAANAAYKIHLENHTTLQAGVSVTDFRSMHKPPEGNRFLVYSLFPQTYVNIKLYREGLKIGVKVGHSIINPECRINVGQLMAAYGGGGHYGAGACRLEFHQASYQLNDIIKILIDNKPADI